MYVRKLPLLQYELFKELFNNSDLSLPDMGAILVKSFMPWRLWPYSRRKYVKNKGDEKYLIFCVVNNVRIKGPVIFSKGTTLFLLTGQC